MYLYLKKILHISRPHIWIYTLGSFLLGVTIGSYATGETIYFSYQLLFLILLLTLPINLFLYALNDAFDIDTDKNNPKKTSFENRALSIQKKELLLISTISIVLLLGTFLFVSIKLILLLLLWIFIVVTYNVPPTRLKARPFLDMLFALNFPLFGVIGYVFITNTYPDILYIFMLIFFSFSMHLYTSIHDLSFDKKARVTTTAVFLKSTQTNLYTSVFIYLPVVILLTIKGLFLLSFASLVYPIFFILQATILKKENELVQYRRFIKLHYVVGFIFTMYFIFT